MPSYRHSWLCRLTLTSTFFLASCGGDDLLSSQDVSAGAPASGSTPFIASVTLHGAALDRAEEIRFEIEPAAGSTVHPVRATFTRSYLSAHGGLQEAGTSIRLPVFGLYAGRTNAVDVEILFADGSVKRLPISVVTPAYVDANAVYDHIAVVQPHVASAALDYDFFYVRNELGAPVIVDTDGQVRWTGTGVATSSNALWINNGFVSGSETTPEIYRMDLDGSVTSTTLDSTHVASFHHDIERGKLGLFANVNGVVGGTEHPESLLDEIGFDGSVLGEWDMNQIIGEFMAANGDDPSLFVRSTVDWFHMNTAVYDPSDDSVILSSRENFVIKVDYSTKAIRWIFGDTTKYWYTFPSLRSKAITLVGGGLVPIGQHAVTLAPDGSLLMFNDGGASFNQPTDAPAGLSRPYAAVSDYTIDAVAMTAVENWHYDHGQTYASDICSSVEQRRNGALLIDYATTDVRSTMHLVGVDPAGAVAFDYKLPSFGCRSGWSAKPIAMDRLFFH